MQHWKQKGRQLDHHTATGGTASCRDDNLRCRRRRQSRQIDGTPFSVRHHSVTRVANMSWISVTHKTKDCQPYISAVIGGNGGCHLDDQTYDRNSSMYYTYNGI